MAWVAPMASAAARISARHTRLRSSSSAASDGDRISGDLSGDISVCDSLVSAFTAAARSAIPPLPPPPPGAVPLRRDPRHYNLLISAFSSAGRHDDVLRLYADMRRLPDCRPNLHCFTSVIQSLALSNRRHLADSVLADMAAAAVRPDAAACTVLVNLYADSFTCIESVDHFLAWMSQCGVDPDPFTYSSLISLLCKSGRIADAILILDEMKCSPTADTYNPIVQYYCDCNRFRDVKRVLDTMCRAGCPPDVVTYNCYINFLCRIGSYREVDRVMSQNDWEPDAVTYTTYINGLCKAGRVGEAVRQLEVMLTRGLSPTTVTLNILLAMLCREVPVLEVKCLLERSGELGLCFDVVGYNTVMCRLSEGRYWVAVLKLFCDMVKKGIDPDMYTFNIVINSLCKANELNRAKCMLENKGFVADIVTYNTLIHGFYVAGKLKELCLLQFDMNTRNIVPDTVTNLTIVDHFCGAGRLLVAIDFVRTREAGFSQELVARLAHWLVMGGKHRLLFRLFREMSSTGMDLDFQIFEFLIKAFCKNGACENSEIHEVCFVLDTMLGIG